MRKRIVVLQNGFVFMGMWHPATDTQPAHITEAVNIRRRGTSAGLGEIALKGPTKDTVLDPVGIVVLDNPEAVLFTVPCTYAD